MRRLKYFNVSLSRTIVMQIQAEKIIQAFWDASGDTVEGVTRAVASLQDSGAIFP